MTITRTVKNLASLYLNGYNFTFNNWIIHPSVSAISFAEINSLIEFCYRCTTVWVEVMADENGKLFAIDQNDIYLAGYVRCYDISTGATVRRSLKATTAMVSIGSVIRRKAKGKVGNHKERHGYFLFNNDVAMVGVNCKKVGITNLEPNALLSLAQDFCKNEDVSKLNSLGRACFVSVSKEWFSLHRFISTDWKTVACVVYPLGDVAKLETENTVAGWSKTNDYDEACKGIMFQLFTRGLDLIMSLTTLQSPFTMAQSVEAIPNPNPIKSEGINPTPQQALEMDHWIPAVNQYVTRIGNDEVYVIKAIDVSMGVFVLQQADSARLARWEASPALAPAFGGSFSQGQLIKPPPPQRTISVPIDKVAPLILHYLT